MDELNINFDVYEDGTLYYGMASVALPTLANKTQTLSGAGIAGDIEAISVGHIDTMTTTLNFRTTTPESIALSEPRRHTLDLRVAQQHENPVDNSVEVKAEKHVMIVIPKSHNVGTVAPSSPANASGEYIVRYWATWLDGVKVREIDPLNFIYMVNGVDYLGKVRKALGK